MKVGRVLTRLDMKVSIILICGTLFLACVTDKSVGADGPASASSVDPVHPIPPALEKFLAGVPRYSEASSFAILKEVTAPARLFPDYHFFSLVFRMHPIARVAPEPLKEQNILIVSPSGSVQQVNDSAQLEHFFKEKLGSRRDEASQKEVVQAWLALSQTFVQDGMFQFSIPPESLKLTRIDSGAEATGKAVVVPGGGNRGEIIATLHFTSSGELTSVKEERNVQPGVRPICQATRLLDSDPIVRAMAAQDLLIMGRAAMPYLREQRKTATPELAHAIDAISDQIEARESAWEKTR